MKDKRPILAICRVCHQPVYGCNMETAEASDWYVDFRAEGPLDSIVHMGCAYFYGEQLTIPGAA